MSTRDEIEVTGLPPLDPIKHPLRDEAERAWIAGYARQGILSYSKRPPSPFAQFLQGFVAGRETLARSALSRPAPATEAKCPTCHGAGFWCDYSNPESLTSIAVKCDDPFHTPRAGASEGEVIDKHARGLYGKFRVERTDGKSAPGQKHEGCRYFVLDVTHDPLAPPALLAYAAAAREAGYGPLADDLTAMAPAALRPTPPAAEVVAAKRREFYEAARASLDTNTTPGAFDGGPGEHAAIAASGKCYEAYRAMLAAEAAERAERGEGDCGE